MNAQPVPDPPADPADLPLFAHTAAVRPGRRRSQFTLHAATRGADRATVPALVVAPPADPTGLLVDRATASSSLDGVGVAGRAGVDWSLVARFRSLASERLSAALGDDRARLGAAAQQELGRAIIAELLQAEVGDTLAAGGEPWSLAEQHRLAEAVFHALFGLGRLQPLVDDDRVENIIITGHDRVRLELTDGTQQVADPVADSDQELIDFLVFLASRSEVNARPFSAATPGCTSGWTAAPGSRRRRG